MRIRRLGSADLDACTRLATSRQWGPERHKWALLLDVGQGYGIDAPDGDGLAATNILTRYGHDHAVISMVLTAERHARQGLARALMEHALEEAGDRTVSLHATEQGRPLYERLGFRTVGRVAKHTGVFAGEPSGATRPATGDDLGAILALDAEIFGTDRSEVLRRMFGFGLSVRVAEKGFGHCWRNDTDVVIGPVVAQDLATAQALIGDLALDAGGEVRMDLDLAQEELVAWAVAHGMGRPWEVSLMVRHGSLPGDRTRQFLPFMQALG
ncbi:GNAT family N-acetyltransferase [Nonomuraea sp. SMC257]|uniref:GNAT family N-acetyltransferase n=1 Tax=Nonomuraea montanisoli TaxID=2741721 RepID=A0A7Y6ID67_9ACTN|nr:GNAT family N-acetyltransferase [Nonomuraea montanisoli]NUW36104.1 GNAT family N-acetyltransferase [Nonomuraea montanisoli]